MLGYSRDLQHAATFSDLASATQTAVTHATRYKTMSLGMFESSQDGEWVRMLVTSGTGGKLIWEETPRFPVGSDPMLLEIRTGRHPVVVSDARTDPRTDKEIIARTGFRTIINVPLLLGDVVLGALGVATFGDEGVMPPTSSELEHLTVFATQLGAAFERVRLLEEKRRTDLAASALEKQRDELELQLRRAQKLEAVGTLAGGIAHDFNNVLTAILAHAELMQLSLPEDHELQESIQTILSSGRRAAHLTRNLLSFSRRQIVSRRPIALQRIANGVANLVGPILREDITLSLELAASDVMVMADEAELEQIVMNLVTNARDAMPKGGKICISVGEFTVDDAFILAHGGGLLGKCAVLTVTDTGEGMSAETVEKIFEPFFTTKEAGRGTGLGLATTHSVVEEHGGKITVDSAPGKGTKMSIYLPLTAAVVAPSTALEAKAGARGNETILVAEDEEVVRSVISRLLRSHGYRVIEAVDGQDAIDKFRNESGHIDLVLTDMVMPRRSGLDIYDVVSGFRQGTKVIFTSGYAADVIDQKRVTEQHLQLLAKPVRPTVLLETIRRVLDDKTPPR